MAPENDDFHGSSPYIQYYQENDGRLHGWLLEAKQEGERINRLDPTNDTSDRIMKYIQGEQITGDHPSYLHHVVVNQVKKAVRTHVSALTDLKPMFAWKTENEHFKLQADTLNRLLLVWWVNTNADMELADTIKYSLVCGAGDTIIEYDPNFMEGDNRLIPRDPRDTLPIKPERDRSIQSWEGLTIREIHSIEKLRAKYPTSGAIKEDSGRLGGIFNKFRRMVVSGLTGEPSTLDGLKSSQDPRARERSAFPQCTLYRTFLRDRSINLTGHQVLIGKAGTNWSYLVEPGDRLYPRGRLVLWTEHGVIADGPNPYWHGMFPVARLKLDSWPWSFLGLSLCHDLLPMQDILNTSVNDILQVFSQWVNRGSIWDKNMPESVVQRFDPRKPHWKVRRPNQFSEGFKLNEGPQLPNWTMQFLPMMFQKFDELSETANLSALMQLRQMPGRDTIDKYMEALTPGIRLEARQVEIYLREVAHMIKCNIFQFYTKSRRLMLLGDAGVNLNELDFDPDSMVPSINPGDPKYTKELDYRLDRTTRAKYFMNMFSFYVAPGSILSLQAQEKKMMFLQLARMGYIDFWTLMDMLEVPNVGEPPTVPLPVPDWKPDPNAPGPVPPPMIPRKPFTITERLQAQQQLGIGMTQNASGRKASGQEMPNLEQKSDGRTVMSES